MFVTHLLSTPKVYWGYRQELVDGVEEFKWYKSRGGRSLQEGRRK
jgi:hypothetical protein